MRWFITTGLIFACIITARAEVESVFFDTRESLPVFRAPPEMAREYALFQKSLPFLSEGLVVMTVISFGAEATELPPEKQQTLMRGFNEVYRAIAQDEAMRAVPHTLAYSYASKPPTKGHYYAYLPEEITEDTPSIVFLHGFGGNFLYYTWLLKSEYPDAIILLPTYTYTWFDGSLSYLREAQADFEARHGVQLKQPWLFALSAGGPAGFRLYNEAPDDFAGLVCLASGPLDLKAKDFRPDLDILMINGAQDDRIPLKKVRRMVAPFQQRIPDLRYMEINSDHFFMLTERATCFEWINDYMAEVNAGE